jgi:ubiquinone/menaquinone biosynthesis C-methylase UbiE
MTVLQAQAPDFAAIKLRQQATWGSGDYAAVASRIVLIAEQLVDSADLPAGGRVLDVATGTGNAALAAARSGVAVTGLDYVPELLARGRVRAAADGLDIEFVEGDAEDLPFADASFDGVLSCLGVMFTPDQDRAAAELLRVCRPGGTIALASWTPSSFIGEMLRTVGAHVPSPAGIRSPLVWGTESRLADLFGDGDSGLTATSRTFVFRFPSAEEFVRFFRDNYGPVHRAFAALDEAGREGLWAELVDLAVRHDRRAGSSVAIPSEYLEAAAIRRA